jgi:hypothetical protein
LFCRSSFVRFTFFLFSHYDARQHCHIFQKWPSDMQKVDIEMWSKFIEAS